jgi:hypothetical protein
MATENTLRIRNIGAVKVRRLLRAAPGTGPKAPPTRIVESEIPGHQFERCVHNSVAQGPRTEPFSARRELNAKRESRAARRQSKAEQANAEQVTA